MSWTFSLLRMSLVFFAFQILSSCDQLPKDKPDSTTRQMIHPDRYNVGFLIMEGVYNTELTAPYDIFQHTIFRDGIKAMNTFLVADTHEPVTTFEGIRLLADYNYLTDEVPHIDILVVPSAEHHLDTDLDNTQMIEWVSSVGQRAMYVTSHCDGAFVLAKAGLLDDVASTTFPSDIDKYKEMFPHLDVRDSVLFIHDGKFITSAGGAKSFEAALYLAETLYGAEIARSLAGGLVIDWDKNEVPSVIIERDENGRMLAEKGVSAKNKTSKEPEPRNMTLVASDASINGRKVTYQDPEIIDLIGHTEGTLYFKVCIDRRGIVTYIVGDEMCSTINDTGTIRKALELVRKNKYEPSPASSLKEECGSVAVIVRPSAL